MSKFTTILAILAVSAIAFSACDTPKHPDDVQKDDTPRFEAEEPEVMEEDEMEGEEETMETESETEQEPSEETAMSAEAAQYVEYTAAKYNELKGNKPFVVYFHATWCPTCNVLDEKITDEISSFPKGAMILNADYDTETELRDQYGVNRQTTLVVLDAEGNVSATLTNPSMEKLMEEINKTL
jgi:thiol-disulfide isomerase/thioredoxin